jgi:hypothetical protein
MSTPMTFLYKSDPVRGAVWADPDEDHAARLIRCCLVYCLNLGHVL